MHRVSNGPRFGAFGGFGGRSRRGRPWRPDSPQPGAPPGISLGSSSGCFRQPIRRDHVRGGATAGTAPTTRGAERSSFASLRQPSNLSESHARAKRTSLKLRASGTSPSLEATDFEPLPSKASGNRDCAKRTRANPSEGNSARARGNRPRTQSPPSAARLRTERERLPRLVLREPYEALVGPRHHEERHCEAEERRHPIEVAQLSEVVQEHLADREEHEREARPAQRAEAAPHAGCEQREAVAGPRDRQREVACRLAREVEA